MSEEIGFEPKETFRRVGEAVVGGAKRVGEAVAEAAPKIVEYVASEQFPKLIRNIVFMVMIGIMAYTLIRVFSVVTPTAEYAAGQFATIIGTMITFAVPIMIFFLVFALVRAILRFIG